MPSVSVPVSTGVEIQAVPLHSEVQLTRRKTTDAKVRGAAKGGTQPHQSSQDLSVGVDLNLSSSAPTLLMLRQPRFLSCQLFLFLLSVSMLVRR